MKKLYTLILICISLSTKADNWAQKADFGGGVRQWTCGLSIGTKGYLGLGSPPISNDFWEFDPALNSWTQKANFGGPARYGATGFTIGNKGYVGVGGNFNDFWEYDQSTNTWTQKADYPIGSPMGAVSFSIGNKGYIGTGWETANGVNNHFCEWDQATNTWSQKADLAGPARWLAVGFSIGNKGYITTGATGNGALDPLLNDLWEWDQATDVWVQKASFSVPRVEAMGFSIGNYGYVGVGSIVWGSVDTNDFWEYNPATDTWTQVADFGGGQRELAQGFSVGCKGYYGAGIINDVNAHSDFWEYTPNSYVCATGIDESISNELTIYTGPGSDQLTVIFALPLTEKISITITDTHGKNVYRKLLTQRQMIINISNLFNGIYFVTIDKGKEKAVRKFLKE